MATLSTAAPWLDLLSRPTADPGAATPTTGTARDDSQLTEKAGALIDFSLAEHEQIAGLDVKLGRLALRYTDWQGAYAIRYLYEQWADRAEELLRRVRSLGLHRVLAEQWEKLLDVVGRTRAMLSISLDSLERADEQIRNGDVISIEEVRRELRARSRA